MNRIFLERMADMMFEVVAWNVSSRVQDWPGNPVKRGSDDLFLGSCSALEATPAQEAVPGTGRVRR